MLAGQGKGEREGGGEGEREKGERGRREREGGKEGGGHVKRLVLWVGAD